MKKRNTAVNETVNIYELIYLALQSDDEAFQLLFEKMKPEMIRIYREKLRCLLPLEDWLVNCASLLYGAIHRYRTDLKISFWSYFHQVVSNAATDQVRTATRERRRPEQPVLSLDGLMECAGDSVREIRYGSNHYNGEDFACEVTAKTALEQLLAQVDHRLKEQDKLVLACLSKGMSQAETAEYLNLTKGRVSYVLRKVRQVVGNLTAQQTNVIV